MKVEVEIMLIQLRKNVALLWILRILAVPVVLVLFAAGFLLNLLYGVVGAFGGLLSLLGGVAAMLALLDGCYGEAAASAAVAFLISPIALPQLLMWVGNLLICAASALYLSLIHILMNWNGKSTALQNKIIPV